MDFRSFTSETSPILVGMGLPASAADAARDEQCGDRLGDTSAPNKGEIEACECEPGEENCLARETEEIGCLVPRVGANDAIRSNLQCQIDETSVSSESAATDRVRILAEILELTTAVAGCDDERTACTLLANRLQEVVRTGTGDRCRVAIVRARAGVAGKVAAVSGTSSVDRHSPHVRSLAAAAQEYCQSAWQRAALGANHDAWSPTVVHHELDTTGNSMLVAPLMSGSSSSGKNNSYDRHGASGGGCPASPVAFVVIESEPDNAAEGATNRVQRLLTVGAEPLGAAIASHRRVVWRRIAPRWLRAMVRKRSRRLILWIAAAGLVALLLFPFADRTNCRCTLAPISRRYVAAPFAGVLGECLVKPGDVVTEGQVLARLDGTQLRLELSEAIAEQERAAKSRDIQLALGKRSDSQLARLEAERHEQRRRLLEERLKQLELRSPTSGVVVQGDLERSEGAPVTLGQTLFEIAPLDDLCAEIEVDDENIREAFVGQQVSLTFGGYPFRRWDGTIARISPRAEIRDEENVFVAEFDVSKARGELKPGMKGNAVLFGSRAPLVWLLAKNLAMRVARLFA